jgi:hypothetical protein
MKRRTHALNKALEGFVQRRDSSVLIADLNKLGVTKHEYIVEIKASPLQKLLGRRLKKLQRGSENKGAGILKYFQQSLITANHPYCLR